MKLDRRSFFASLGGAAVVASMSDEAKADALERYLMAQATPATQTTSASNPGSPSAAKFPTMAELDAQVATRPTRRGVGNLFAANQGNVPHLPPMPEKPTLVDFYKLRFVATSNHCL
jgi:hypothetical protein